MKLKIVKNWTSLKEKTIFTINISSELYHKWYGEQMRRFWMLSKLEEWGYKDRVLNDNPVFDIDESYECWQMSLSHLQSFILFNKGL